MDIEFLKSMGKIKKIAPDLHRAKSLIESSEKTIATILRMELSDETSTIIFREMYECIRQLGDAKWWLEGYKPKDHEVSMAILKEEEISNSAKLENLDRFRDIRHNANYSGYIIPKINAVEIIEFWYECGEEILENLKSEIQMQDNES